jgi:hypothetical protein
LQVAAIASGLLLSGGVAAWAANAGAGNPASAVPRVTDVTGDSHAAGTSGGDATTTTETDKPDDSTDVTATTETTLVGAPTTTLHIDDNEGNDGQDAGNHDGNHDGDNKETTTTLEETTTTVGGVTTTTVPCVHEGQNGDSQGRDDLVVGSDDRESQHHDDCGNDNDQGEDGHDGDHSPVSTVPERGGNQGD